MLKTGIFVICYLASIGTLNAEIISYPATISVVVEQSDYNQKIEELRREIVLENLPSSNGKCVIILN